MNIESKEIEDVTVVALSGAVDGRTAPILQEQLLPLADSGRKIVLDMGGVTYMSSAGLRILLLLYRHLHQNHGQVVLADLDEMIYDTMAVTGFLEFFAAYDSVDEGIKALHNAAAN